MIVSKHLIDEVQNVLERPKMRRYLPTGRISVYLTRVWNTSTILEDPQSSASFRGLVPADPDDDYILGLAIRSGAQVIVSGDKHLLDLEPNVSFGIAALVQNPREFLEQLNKRR